MKAHVSMCEVFLECVSYNEGWEGFSEAQFFEITVALDLVCIRGIVELSVL